ncbi:hypothetical protein Tco_0578779 [Tanacetum coccineum]
MRKSILKQEFSEFRISESKGLHKGYDRMQKILSQLNQLKAKPDDEDSQSSVSQGIITKDNSTIFLKSILRSHSAFVSTKPDSKKNVIMQKAPASPLLLHASTHIPNHLRFLKLDLTVLSRVNKVPRKQEAEGRIEFDKKEAAENLASHDSHLLTLPFTSHYGVSLVSAG